MTKSELNDTYFNWMCQLVFDGRYSKKLSYRRLLKVLHKIEFTYSIPMDGNRAEDGIDLRYRFGYENGYSSSMISAYLDNKTCSVLEMMIALAIRCEEHGLSVPLCAENQRNCKNLWFCMELPEQVNLRFSILFSSFLRDTIPFLMPKRWVHPAILLHWKHSRTTLSWLFNMMGICQGLKIILD